MGKLKHYSPERSSFSSSMCVETVNFFDVIHWSLSQIKRCTKRNPKFRVFVSIPAGCWTTPWSDLQPFSRIEK